MKNVRKWEDLERRHRAFWEYNEVDRPLIVVEYNCFVNMELVASALGSGELEPSSVDVRPFLGEYDKCVRSHELIGDDAIIGGEPLLGIPWLEAICGCRITIPDGNSIWPESPSRHTEVNEISLSAENPWFNKLLKVLEDVVAHADGRYPVSIGHLRGPVDVLIALMGAESFFLTIIDNPEKMMKLASEVAEVWITVAQKQAKRIPIYRQGFVARQLGLWAPERTAWLQDDSAGTLSLDQYQQYFYEPLRSMSVFPVGVLHQHMSCAHLAEMWAKIPNIRAMNIYLDDKNAKLSEYMPLLRNLKKRRMPLVLCKYADEGLSLEEYDEICQELSSQGLCLHLRAGSIEEGQATMAAIRERAGK